MYSRALVLLISLLLVVRASAQPIIYHDIAIGRSWPRSIGIDPLTNQIFVTTASGIYPPTGFTLTIVNGSSETISSVIPFDGIPGQLAVNHNTKEILVINGSSILIFNSITGSGVGRIQVRAPLYALAVNPTTNEIYATSADTLFEIPPDIQSPTIKRFPIGSYAVGLAINPQTNMVYAANFDSNTVTVFDATKGSVVRTIDLGSTSLNPSELAVNPATNKVYSTTGRNSIVVIDGSTNSVEGSVQVGTSKDGNSTYAIAIDLGKNLVYVASTPAPLITVIDGASNRVIGSVRINYSPYELAFNPVNNRLYVTDYHMLTVIENGPVSTPANNLVSALVVVTILALLVSYVVWRLWKRLFKPAVEVTQSVPAMKSGVLLLHGDEGTAHRNCCPAVSFY